MIAHIRGTIAEKFGNSLIVDVNGVGYEMAVSALDFDASKLNEEKKFYTYHAVREMPKNCMGFRL